jgi:hypothetical protein
VAHYAVLILKINSVEERISHSPLFAQTDIIKTFKLVPVELEAKKANNKFKGNFIYVF